MEQTMNTTHNNKAQPYMLTKKISEAKQYLARPKHSFRTAWLKDVGREVFVWGLIYAIIIGILQLYGLMISSLG